MLIVSWKGTDALQAGSAKAPTDDGLETGKPDVLDATGREHLELRELAVNYSTEDPCIWLRKKDNTLAKFRPTAGVKVVDRATDLPVPGTPAAKALKPGDSYLVRFSPDGVTAENRLVIWDDKLPATTPGGPVSEGWNWKVEPRTYIKQLIADADVATTGADSHQLQEGDLQLTVDPGFEGVKVYTAGAWLDIFSWDRLNRTLGTNHWVGRASDLPFPAKDLPIAEGSMYLVELDLAGEKLDRMFAWKELTPDSGIGQPGAAQTGEWHVMDEKVWVKELGADSDNLTDAEGGNFTVTIEKDNESIKVYDAKAGAWITIPATDTQTVRRWIASLSLFQGTVVETGGSLPGAIDFGALPDLSDPKLATLKALAAHYWIFVGASGATVSATDPNGLARDVLGAKLNPGDWMMISNRSTDPAVVDAHWVVVSGDLLSASRARALYSHETWRPGSYETGTIIVHDKALWRSIAGVTVADGQPVDGVNVAQVTTIDVTAAPGLAAGTQYTATVNGVGATVTTAAVGELAPAITARLIAELSAEPRIANVIKIEPGLMAGTVVDPANVQVKLTARVPGMPFTLTLSTVAMTQAQATANVTTSPWIKVDLAGGVRWVATDKDRDAISNSPRRDIIYVLSSAEARGNGALYYYDSGAKKWMQLGGAGIPLRLSGGTQLLSVGCPVGSMMMWPSASAPRGWLVCDGSPFTAAAFPELAKVLPGLKLPDLRGAYARGAGLNGNGAWGATANVVGGVQEDSTARPKAGFTGIAARAGNHSHTLQLQSTQGTQDMTDWGHASSSGLHPSSHWFGNGGATNSNGDHTHTVTIDGGGDGETRPKTVLVNYIIKHDDTAVIAVNP